MHQLLEGWVQLLGGASIARGVGPIAREVGPIATGVDPIARDQKLTDLGLAKMLEIVQSRQEMKLQFKRYHP